MKTIRQANIKNRQNYFFNDTTNIKNFDPSLLNIDQISFENNDSVIYEIEYFKNLDSLYLVFNNVDAYIAKSSKNKYLMFASTDKNGKALENYAEFWNEIK